MTLDTLARTLVNNQEIWEWLLSLRDESEPIPVPEPEPGEYKTMPFHHTQSDPHKKKDGGKSLVMCSGVNWKFDRVYVEGTDVHLRYHGRDEGRLLYWNMKEAPEGDIIGVKGDDKYRFPCDSSKILLFGKC